MLNGNYYEDKSNDLLHKYITEDNSQYNPYNFNKQFSSQLNTQLNQLLTQECIPQKHRLEDIELFFNKEIKMKKVSKRCYWDRSPVSPSSKNVRLIYSKFIIDAYTQI